MLQLKSPPREIVQLKVSVNYLLGNIKSDASNKKRQIYLIID